MSVKLFERSIDEIYLIDKKELESENVLAEILIWISRNYAISFNFPEHEPKLGQNLYDI